MKGEFVCTNEIFLFFELLVRLRPNFSIWIGDSFKENEILHPLLVFLYSEDELLIRKIFIFSKLNSSAWIKFSLFFSFLCGWDKNSPLNLSQYERELNSACPSCLLLLWPRTFYKKNFNFVKGEFVCTNEIFLIFQFLVRWRRKFSIWICDSLN